MKAGRVLMLGLFAAVAGIGYFGEACGDLPAPPYPLSAYRNQEQGTVVVAVTFGLDGKANSCRVVHSSGVASLDTSSVAFIKSHWQDSSLAGKTVTLPINYVVATGVSLPDTRVPAPPDILSPGAPDRKLKLRITFGDDGRVREVVLVNLSGLDALDRSTVEFVKLRWRCWAWAGSTVEIPFEFKAPPVANKKQG